MTAKPFVSDYLRLLMNLITENNATILMVDNNQEILHIIARFLRFEGYKVIKAPGPSDAVEICKSGESVDLFISDYNLPEVNGLELAAVLRVLRPALPMVFMTRDSQIEQSLLAVGCICLRKPLLLAELQVTITNALRQQKATGTVGA